MGVGMSYFARGSKARVLPDSWSKILFQARARRNNTPTIMQIARKCALATAQGSSQAAVVRRTISESSLKDKQ